MLFRGRLALVLTQKVNYLIIFAYSIDKFDRKIMLIFNTTLHLEDAIHDECLSFLKTFYIPKALESGLLSQPSLAKIERQHEESGVSYAMQFKTEDIDVLNRWAGETGEGLSVELNKRFGTKVGGFVTLLEEVSLL